MSSDQCLRIPIRVSGQPVQDASQALKLHSIQKKVTQIVWDLLTSNAVIRWLWRQRRVKHKPSNIKYGARMDRVFERKRGHSGHDVISCQRETRWRILCIVYVGNRTTQLSLWFSAILAKNGTTEGRYLYFLAVGCTSTLKRWLNCFFFLSCVSIEEHQASDIERYHCPDCALLHGPLTRKWKSSLLSLWLNKRRMNAQGQ